MKPSKEYWILDILETASDNTEEGGVKGRLKMEKLSALVREDIDEKGRPEWGMIADFRGPRDPGLSRLLMSFDDLDLVELEQMRDETLLRRITAKGRSYFASLDRFFNKIDPDFEEEKERIESDVIDENVDKSGNELVELDEIKELKNNTLGDDL